MVSLSSVKRKSVPGKQNYPFYVFRFSHTYLFGKCINDIMNDFLNYYFFKVVIFLSVRVTIFKATKIE